MAMTPGVGQVPSCRRHGAHRPGTGNFAVALGMLTSPYVSSYRPDPSRRGVTVEIPPGGLGTTTPPFRLLDLVVYSPLCLALALGAHRTVSSRPRPLAFRAEAHRRR